MWDVPNGCAQAFVAQSFSVSACLSVLLQTSKAKLGPLKVQSFEDTKLDVNGALRVVCRRLLNFDTYTV